jgi:mutator protein MutT
VNATRRDQRPAGPGPDRLTVTAAVIRKDGALLIARRRPGGALSGKWEFPGGKMEPGEDERECLARELREELAIEAAIGEFIVSVPFEHKDRLYELKAFQAEWISGELTLLDHAEVRWVTEAELPGYDFADSDQGIVRALLGAQAGD